MAGLRQGERMRSFASLRMTNDGRTDVETVGSVLGMPGAGREAGPYAYCSKMQRGGAFLLEC
jgi:hypothetical protein